MQVDLDWQVLGTDGPIGPCLASLGGTTGEQCNR
jgi:hypothetical protein